MPSQPGPHSPRGTVTFLFTDMEGSTRLLQRLGEAFPAVLEEHKRLTTVAFEQSGGRLVDMAGDGLFFAFERARDALVAAVDAQRALRRHAWPEGAEVRVRMGLHTGEPVASASGYVGLDVHRAARISAAAHGGQIVLSEATRQLVAADLPPGIELEDLGEHRLKDLPRLERLHQVRAPGLPGAFPPLRSASRPLRANLPARLLPLIGRERELSTIRELLRRDDVRLLTLTGTGGTGKTSLAAEAAARSVQDFRDGVAWVPLASISDPALVVAAVAQTLAVSPRGDERLLHAVLEALRERKVLLVLDNFEHVLAAAADVAALVTSCPDVSVVVTSRFALRLSMEREFPVTPLGTPDPTRTGTLATLVAYPAVELFAQRAAAVRPGFGLDDERARTVAQICHRLDGLPLAIELAAARIKLFSPRALLARLDRSLEVLGDGARDLPARHRTLRHAIGWSYDLLEPREQALFRRLAVFAAGFALESAEAVAASAGDPGLPVFDGVAALVDKSLLRREPGEEDEPRFRMLETVREFALERLAASGEEEAARAAHADELLAFAEAAAPELAGPAQRTWLPRLEREHDDLRAAFDWTIRAADAGRALRLGAALGRFWIMRGFHTEGRQRLRAALALPAGAADEPVRARVLSGAAILAYEQGALEEAEGDLGEALELFRARDDARGVAETLNHLGWVAFFAGDLERARALSEEARATHEARGDERGVALSLTNLGGIALQRGELTRALELYERALELRRAQNDARSVAYGSINAGWTLVRMGELERARALAAEAEHTLRTLDDKQILAFACFVLGEVELERGRATEAVPHLEESVALGREVMQGSSLGLALGVLAEALARAGRTARATELAREAVTLQRRTTTGLWLVLALRCQGDVLRLAGDGTGARASYQEGLQRAASSGMRLYAAECLGGLAALASDDGRHARAARLAAAARALRALVGAPWSPRWPDPDRIDALARAALGDEAAARARVEGEAAADEGPDGLLERDAAGER